MSSRLDIFCSIHEGRSRSGGVVGRTGAKSAGRLLKLATLLKVRPPLILCVIATNTFAPSKDSGSKAPVGGGVFPAARTKQARILTSSGASAGSQYILV